MDVLCSSSTKLYDTVENRLSKIKKMILLILYYPVANGITPKSETVKLSLNIHTYRNKKSITWQSLVIYTFYFTNTKNKIHDVRQLMPLIANHITDKHHIDDLYTYDRLRIYPLK